MNPKAIQDLITVIHELQIYLGSSLSFFAGLSTGIAFVIASKMEWFK